MSFESGKKLGFTASIIHFVTPIISAIIGILSFLAVLPNILANNSGASFTFWLIILTIVVAIVGFIGSIMFLLGMRQLARYYNDPSIYRYTLYGFIAYLAGVASAYIFQTVFYGSPFSNFTAGSSSLAFNSFIESLIPLIVISGSSFIIAIITAIFYHRSFNLLANKTGINNFRTAGTLYLIGTVLTIILIGALIVWIAWIFSVIGFSALKKTDSSSQWYSQQTPTSNQLQYCIYCGAANLADTVYCQTCGKQFRTS